MPFQIRVEQLVGVQLGRVAGQQVQFDAVGVVGQPSLDRLAAVDRVPVGDHMNLPSGLPGQPVQEAGEDRGGEAAGEHGEPQRPARATADMTVRIPGAAMQVRFAEGEYIRTEISAKFRTQGIAAELAESGFAVQRWWTDAQNRFGVSLSRATR